MQTPWVMCLDGRAGASELSSHLYCSWRYWETHWRSTQSYSRRAENQDILTKNIFGLGTDLLSYALDETIGSTWPST